MTSLQINCQPSELHHHQEKGTEMNHSEHTARKPSSATGRLATLRAFLRSQGSGPSSRRRTITTLATLATALGALVLTAAPALAAGGPPVIAGLTASNVASSAATLGAEVNPENQTTSCIFEYGKTKAAKLEKEVPCEQGNPAGTLEGENQGVSVNLTGLSIGTKYFYRLVAKSANGPAEAEGELTTAIPPEAPVTSSPAKSITATTALLEGTLNPIHSAKDGWYFAYSNPGGSSCGEGPTTALESEVTGKALKEHTEVTGLQPHQTYVFCMVTANAAEPPETAPSSNEVTFETLPAPPKIDSESASAVTPVKATLEAQVNPNNEPITYMVEYSKTKAGGKLTGAVVKVNGTSSLEGGSDLTASVSTGSILEPGTTYFYRVVAENKKSKEEGKPVEGAIQEFMTIPSPFTEAATEITTTTATVNGTLTPLSAIDTKWDFDYKRLAEGAGCTGESSTTLEEGTGTGTKAVSAKAINLQPNVTYTVCLVSSNTFGSEVGAPVSFNTNPAPPKVDSESSSTTPSGIEILEAQINPNNQETNYTFEYSTTESSKQLTGSITTVKGIPLKAVFGDEEEREAEEQRKVPPANVTPSAVLAPGTTYYYRVIAENVSGEKEEGTVQSFTTLPLPAVSTGEAQGITQTTATLSGTVNPEGAETSYYFEYINQEAYEKAIKGDAEEKADPYSAGERSAVAVAPPIEGSNPPEFPTEPQTVPPTPISGLQPGKTYYYVLVAESGVGRETGQPETLTTPGATPPIVSTGAASGVSQNAATLTGTVDTNGLQTEYGFEIGTEPGNYGPATGLGSIGGATTAGVSVTLGELQPGTTYYYRVTATNADGTVPGQPASFATPGFPTLIAAPGIAFPKEEAVSTGGTTTKALTKAQKLSKALKACKQKKGDARAKCEKQAKAKYGVSKKAKKGKKK
jgi:phosphodiesterase/alkaline phosphatase D-like protein